MLLILFLTTTQIVKAVCTCTLDINTELEIDAKEAIFLRGEEVNLKMKQLAGTDLSSLPEEEKFTAVDTNITAIKHSETEPDDTNKQEANIVSTPESGYPIYMWFDNGTIYWWSEDETPSLNVKAMAMFGYLHNLEDISGVSTFDLSATQSINSIFYHAKLSNLDDIINWNTKEIKDFAWAFTHNTYLTNIEGIENWNVKKATDLSGLFMACFSLEEADLRNWETTDTLRNIYGMFAMCTDEGKPTMEGILKRVYLSDKFNTSKVINMGHFLSNDDEIEDYEFLKYLDTSSVKSFQAILQNNYNFNNVEYIKDWDTSNLMMLDWAFFNNKSLDDITGLSNWNTSKLKYMSDVFERDILISDFSEIENWDTSNVENMNSLFEDCSNVTKLNLSKWNTSKVKDMGYMFNGLTSLEELDISSFDTSNVTTFKRMFNNSTALKHIYVGDGWDTSANTGEETYVFPASSSLPNYDPTDSTRQYLSHAHTGEGGYLELRTNN
jgi:surface protein